MNFSVVEIPVGPTTPISPLAEALIKNVGKALSIPCEKKDASNLRKSLRTGLVNRGILEKHTFHSRIDPANKSLIVWLQEINPTGPSEDVTAEASRDKR